MSQEVSRVFKAQQVDLEGMQTLENISGAPKFNRWMYETVAKHCSGDILEIGSGLGNISDFFISDGYSLALSDLRENYLDILSEKFSPTALDIFQLDLEHPDFEMVYQKYIGRFDTVFALNVVEHIETFW